MTEYAAQEAPILAVILPCFNEEEALPGTLATLSPLLRDLVSQGAISDRSFILCVDDGSKDATWEIIASTHEENALVRGLKLAGNAGHQKALLAGMLAVKDEVDCAVTMDADLQDDLAVIAKMLDAYKTGSHVVYGVREDRKTDGFFKKNTAALFYKGMKLMGTSIIPGHADFRLMSALALKALDGYGEGELFLRTLIPGMKLPSSCVYYARKSRLAGVTKYPFRKMVAFALQGIVSSSLVPLRISAFLGLVTFILALLQSLFALASYWFGHTVPGWTSLMLAVLYIGSVQLFCMSVLGEYVARTFLEAKRRPRYIVEKELK